MFHSDMLMYTVVYQSSYNTDTSMNATLLLHGRYLNFPYHDYLYNNDTVTYTGVIRVFIIGCVLKDNGVC